MIVQKAFSICGKGVDTDAWAFGRDPHFFEATSPTTRATASLLKEELRQCVNGS